MTQSLPIHRSERGAVFVQVGIAAFVLVAFNVFVLDYGMMWVSRRQAQNAADAGALAGAVARGYDDFDSPPSSTGYAAQAATQVALANQVWQQPATPRVLFDCPAGVTGRCVRLEVYRNGEFGSTPIPTMFGPMLGIGDQGVRAVATAISANANGTNCLKPLALPNEWIHQRDPLLEFNRYDPSGPPGTLLPTPDGYVRPSSSDPGTFTISGDFTERVDFVYDQDHDAPITRGLMFSMTLPGSNTYAQNITGCNGQSMAFNQAIPIFDPVPGQTRLAMEALYAQDPGADWNYAEQKVFGTCAPGCAPISPRLIAVALFDPDHYQYTRTALDWSSCPGGTSCVFVTNIAGFFVHRLTSTGGHGHFVRYPGITVASAPTYVDDASWLVTSHLIR
jgi:hypothetical protein